MFGNLVSNRSKPIAGESAEWLLKMARLVVHRAWSRSRALEKAD
jgi:hypothetical protein